MGDFFYGKSARYQIGSPTPTPTPTPTPAPFYCGKGWSIDPTVEELRTDNTCDNGFTDRIGGPSNATFTIEQDWDASFNPMDDPPGLRPGVVLTDLKLHFDSLATEAPLWVFPKAIILGSPMSVMVDTIAHITFNGANKGPFGYPVGTFTPSPPEDPTT
jgi:hypothetical protein